MRDLDIANRLPKLQDAISEDSSNPEDRFQAQVCTGWLHWVVGDYRLAIQWLPQINDPATALDAATLALEWTHVCALKSAYLRANCLTRDGRTIEALDALRSAIPVLSRVESGKAIRKQLRYWSELFLTEYCMLSSEVVKQGDVTSEHPAVLAPFRSWASYWQVMQAPVTGGFGFKGSVPRRQVWRDYYMALSHILQSELPYEAGLIKRMPADLPPRGQLRTEIKYAEAAYRSLLLAETPFPRADEDRQEVEDFVRQAVKNWSVLCGRGWHDQDLGQGGRRAMSRGLLETLYSAATRTYHSTAILRSLFAVHLSLAEFDLAFKAFDSYLDIVKRGKARVDKTGEAEPGLDRDDTVLETMAQAIMALCRYGGRQAGEKARRLGAELEDWLSRLQVKGPQNGTGSIAEDEARSTLHPPVDPHVVALAWQAIGHSHAHWSRLTTEAGSRMEIQAKAVRCFRKSISSEFGRCKDIRSFFSLALLLAERRELTPAIDLVRSALMAAKGQDQGNDLLNGPYWQERTLIPLWHLLALLLSARQDYAMAFRACEGALEQFKDPTLLFGKSDPSFRGEHLEVADFPRGLVDSLEDSEKESILEIKMTQLALIELTEGPDMAVNSSFELLTMFTRLFGNITAQAMPAESAPAQPPRTSATLRGIRGSIFGAKKDKSAPSTRMPSTALVSEKSASGPSRPSTAHSTATARPSIQVTAENDGQAMTSRPRADSAGQSRRRGSRRRNSLKKRNRSGSRHRPDTAGAVAHQATVVDGDVFFTPAQEPEQADLIPLPSRSPQGRLNSSKGKSNSVKSYLAASAANKIEDPEPATEIVHAPPHLLPLIQFPEDQERAQRVTILVKIWLTVAGFYRRADMLEDSKGAIAEAQKLVQDLEMGSVSRRQAGSKSAGWAERKSVDDLWGDVWTEVRGHDAEKLRDGVLTGPNQLGLLAVAQVQPLVARSDLEQALTYSADHPAATAGLCNILLDISSEKLLPAPVVPPLDCATPPPPQRRPQRSLAPGPLGLCPRRRGGDDGLPVAYKTARLPLADRLAARDRAFTLLTGLTRLGSGWDCSDAWFALARAYEESGQPDKAKEVLWWCVELEEAMAVRDWRCLGGGGGYLIP